MTRRCEVFTRENGWALIDRLALAVGMVFRLFEEDGAPVADEDGVTRWRVTGLSVGADGQARVESEQMPETDVETAVRRTGVFWPGQIAQRGPWTPGRLR